MARGPDSRDGVGKRRVGERVGFRFRQRIWPTRYEIVLVVKILLQDNTICKCNHRRQLLRSGCPRASPILIQTANMADQV